MLSAKVFNMVEFVCRHVKKTDTVFGGIQVCIINKGNYLCNYVDADDEIVTLSL